MWPIVRFVDSISGGANARNWPGFVIVRKDLSYPAATIAQEAWESSHKTDPVKLFFRVFKRSKQDAREFEYMGHMVEAYVMWLVYDVPIISAIQSEARSLKRGYDGLFAHLSLVQIEVELTKRMSKAAKWVNDNYDRIKRYK